MDWDWIFSSFSEDEPGFYEPASEGRPATVYLPTREYAELQVNAVASGLGVVVMSDSEADRRERFKNFMVAAGKERLDVTFGYETAISNTNLGWIKFMVCTLQGASTAHSSILMMDRPDGEYRNPRALAEAQMIPAPIGDQPVLIVKPLRNKLTWWIVRPSHRPQDFVRVLAGTNAEARMLGAQQIGTYSNQVTAEELK